MDIKSNKIEIVSINSLIPHPKNNNPVFISEYSLPDKRFKEIYKTKKRSRLGHSYVLIKDEKVFVNLAAYKLLINNKMKR